MTVSAVPDPIGAAAPRARDWYVALPKVENHVHLEGSLEATVLQAAALRGGRELIASIATNLDELLEINDRNCSLLTMAEDLAAAASARAHTAGRLGIRYSDLIVNPGHWPAWTDRMDAMVEALDEGFRLAEDAGAPRTSLALSIGRQMSAEQAEAIVEAAIDGGGRVRGISLDGNESAPGAGSERFAPAVRRARDFGLHVAVHSGESGGPDAVWRTLRVFDPERIDHGVRSIEDPALVDELARRGTTLAVCPTSNLVLGVVPALESHPLERLRRAGVPVTINTDDPLVFGTDLAREYQIAAESFGWGTAQILEVVRVAIAASTAPDDLRTALLAEIELAVLHMPSAPTGE